MLYMVALINAAEYGERTGSLFPPWWYLFIYSHLHAFKLLGWQELGQATGAHSVMWIRSYDCMSSDLAAQRLLQFNLQHHHIPLLVLLAKCKIIHLQDVTEHFPLKIQCVQNESPNTTANNKPKHHIHSEINSIFIIYRLKLDGLTMQALFYRLTMQKWQLRTLGSSKFFPVLLITGSNN